jgi:transcriptional regulator with XRE-family HTH domain
MWTGTILREARRRASLTQRDLAERCGLPQSTIGRIEAGSIDPRATTLRRLLRACGSDLEAAPLLGEGVDRSQIRGRLERSPHERLEDLTAAASAIRRVTGVARSAR